MRRTGGTWGQGGIWPPDFGPSLNPFPNRVEAYYTHHIITCPPSRISRPSTGSELREGRKYDIGQTNLQVSTTCRDELMLDQLTFQLPVCSENIIEYFNKISTTFSILDTYWNQDGST